MTLKIQCMKYALLSFLGLTCLFAISGCASKAKSDSSDHAVLIEIEPGKVLLSVNKKIWKGLWGPEGYIGYQRISYWAALNGSGPVFVNPHFQDNPSGFHCVGTIVVDRDHNLVTLDMRRVVSKSSQPDRTAPHPANGHYQIDTIRKPQQGENWF